MNSSTFNRVGRAVALSLGALAFATAVLDAQESRRTSTVTVWSDPAIATVMLVDTLPAPASAKSGAVLIRRPGDPPNNIILVTPATSPRELSQAVTALAFSRRSQGETVGREMRTAIAAVPQTPGPCTRDARRADTALRRLRSAPEFNIPNVGRGPAIVVRMAAGAVTKSPAKKSAPSAPPRP